MNEPASQPEENPYLVTQVADVASSEPDHSRPGTEAIGCSVIAGLAVAVPVFVITCEAVILTDVRIIRGGVGIGILGVTTVAAFVFTVWGFRKIVRALKR